MTRDYAISLAKALNMKISEEVIESILAKHVEFVTKLDSLKTIDTTGVEPMHRVDETETTFLREDVEGDSLPVETIIKNAPESQGNFVALGKVVK